MYYFDAALQSWKLFAKMKLHEIVMELNNIRFQLYGYHMSTYMHTHKRWQNTKRQKSCATKKRERKTKQKKEEIEQRMVTVSVRKMSICCAHSFISSESICVRSVCTKNPIKILLCSLNLGLSVHRRCMILCHWYGASHSTLYNGKWVI